MLKTSVLAATGLLIALFASGTTASESVNAVYVKQSNRSEQAVQLCCHHCCHFHCCWQCCECCECGVIGAYVYSCPVTWGCCDCLPDCCCSYGYYSDVSWWQGSYGYGSAVGGVDPYLSHFGPGNYGPEGPGHYRFPYYSYRRPWYTPGPPVFNRNTEPVTYGSHLVW